MRGREGEPPAEPSMRALDPGGADPGYWARLQARIVARASGELARRRATRGISVEELVFSWSRALAPAALLAAAAAGLILFSDAPTPETPLALDELPPVELPASSVFEAEDGAVVFVEEAF